MDVSEFREDRKQCQPLFPRAIALQTLARGTTIHPPTLRSNFAKRLECGAPKRRCSHAQRADFLQGTAPPAVGALHTLARRPTLLLLSRRSISGRFQIAMSPLEREMARHRIPRLRRRRWLSTAG